MRHLLEPKMMPDGRPRRWLILGALSLATLIVQVDQTGLILALPRMQQALRASAVQLQWVLDAYSLALAGTVLSAGAVSDRVGRRRIFLAGVGLFALTSAGAALATTPKVVIAARAFMGIGAGMFMPGTLSILTQVFDPESRARAIGFWGSITSLGVILGPLAGGAVLQAFGWSAIFVMNVLVAAVAFIAALLLVPESRNPEPATLDPVGALLGAAGVLSLTWSVIAAPQYGPTSRVVMATVVAAAVLLIWFVLHCRHRPHGMFDLTIARSRDFQGASIAAAGVMFAMTGLLYVITQQLQLVLGFGTFRAGLAILPLAAAVALASSSAPQLAKRFSSSTVMGLGLTVVSAAAFCYAVTRHVVGYSPVLGALVLLGLGMGLTIAPANDLLMGSGPSARSGLISSMNDTVQELGTAFGVAVTGAVLNAIYTHAMATAGQTARTPAQELAGTTRSLPLDAFNIGSQSAAVTIAITALVLAVGTTMLTRGGGERAALASQEIRDVQGGCGDLDMSAGDSA